MLSCLLQSFIFWYVVAALIVLKVYIKRKTGVCRCEVNLQGKTVIVTGANTGIGKATALQLATKGAKVILGCRNIEKGKKVRDEITKYTGNKKISVLHLDLTSLTSVRRFASNVLTSEEHLDILIHNAGAFRLGNRKTADKLQIGMQVNYFAPFLLTYIFTDLLKRSAPSRVIMVSSGLHRFANFDLENLNADKSFNEINIYACSKLANILTANELTRRLAETGVTVNSVDPGFVFSELFRYIPPPLYTLVRAFLYIFGKNSHEGAQTTIHVAVSKELDGVTGKYFSECKEAVMSEKARDMKLAKDLWEKTEVLLNLKP